MAHPAGPSAEPLRAPVRRPASRALFPPEDHETPRSAEPPTELLTTGKEFAACRERHQVAQLRSDRKRVRHPPAGEPDPEREALAAAV